MTRKKSTSSGKKRTTRTASARSGAGRRTRTKKTPTRGGTRSRRSSSRKTSRPARKRSRREIQLSLQQKALVIGIGTILITFILVLSLLSPNQGQLTSALARLLWRGFGWGGAVMPLITGGVGLYLVLWGMEQPPAPPPYRVFGAALLFLTFEAFASLSQVMLDTGFVDVWTVAQAQRGGGYLGGAFAYLLIGAIGKLGAVFVLVVLGVVATILFSGLKRSDVAHFLGNLRHIRTVFERSSKATERQIAINPNRSARPEAPRSLAVQPPLVPEMGADQAAAALETPGVEPAMREVGQVPQSGRSNRRVRGRRQGATSGEGDAGGEAPTVPTPIFLGNMSRRASRSWTLPVLPELLEPGSEQDVNSATIREQVEIIEHTLDSFGAPATVVEINQGPAVTQFGVEPNFIEQRSGKRTKVKVGKIASLADDIALALAAQSIRIQAPVPGKGYVGIEVPNVQKALVSLRDVMESAEFAKYKSSLRIGLGQNVAGQPIAADLASMPHLLIAGTTGSGKSVCVNSIIACLLLQNTPDDLRLVMVDPKRVELTGYNGIPHLAAPVVVEMDRVIGTLQWAMREMESRYKQFADVGARNINDYNKKIGRRKDNDRMFHIVIIIDELADLMMLSPEETERGVTRLAQMARATGIHMVIATQRPSVDVVTGLIKANFPARIAFAVASSTDSRVILDTTGAERLLGQGDMLFQSPDAAAPVRLQGCFVSDKELSDLIEYWQKARRFNVVTAESSIMPRSEVAAVEVADEEPADAGAIEEEEATIEPEPVEPEPAEMPTVPAPRIQPLWEELQQAEEQAKFEDELMPEAIAMVRKLSKASTSLLQRRFRIGYTRAARLIDSMEEEGIIGPPTGTSKARDVLPWKDGDEDQDGETTASDDGEGEEEA